MAHDPVRYTKSELGQVQSEQNKKNIAVKAVALTAKQTNVTAMANTHKSLLLYFDDVHVTRPSLLSGIFKGLAGQFQMMS